MQLKVNNFLNNYSQAFKKFDLKKLCGMYYVPNAFVFDDNEDKVLGFAFDNDLQDYLSNEFCKQLHIEQSKDNSMEIVKVLTIKPGLILAESNWVHYLEDGKQNVQKFNCLFTLINVNNQLKIASTIFNTTS